VALKLYRNTETKEEKRSLKKLPSPWVEILTAPNQKFMVTADVEHGKSKIKDQDKMLKARSRNYSRDVNLDDNIAINTANGLTQSVAASFLNKKGERRRKIDDI
jgi:hypothetical protein